MPPLSKQNRPTDFQTQAAPRGAFQSLPADVLALVAKQLPTYADVACFASTCTVAREACAVGCKRRIGHLKSQLEYRTALGERLQPLADALQAGLDAWQPGRQPFSTVLERLKGDPAVCRHWQHSAACTVWARSSALARKPNQLFFVTTFELGGHQHTLQAQVNGESPFLTSVQLVSARFGSRAMIHLVLADSAPARRAANGRSLLYRELVYQDPETVSRTMCMLGLQTFVLSLGLHVVRNVVKYS